MMQALSNYISEIINGQKIKIAGKATQWKKVNELKAGMKIAVADSSDTKVEFDEIVSVSKVGRERVFDIEIEGTHNFVGNGILAHNTYIEGGNLGIGTTNPSTSFEVNGQVKVDDLTAAGGGSTVLSSAGILTTVSSSARYKENITDYGHSLDVIKKLRPVDFTWKGNTLTPGMKDFGLIAEEVAQIAPGLVTYELDNTTIRGVKYDKLPILLIKAMQEQQGQIDLTKTTADTALKTANSVKETVTAQTNLIAALQGQVDILKTTLPVNPTPTPTPTPTPSLTPSPSPSPSPTPPNSPTSPDIGIGVSSPTDLGIGASGPTFASGFWLPSPESTPSAIQTNYDVNIFQDLHVLGKFIAQDIGLTGTLRNGVLVIDGLEGSVQTLSGSLKLQKDALGPIEIMGSLIEIDQKGNLHLAAGYILGNESWRGTLSLAASQTSQIVKKVWDTAPATITITSSYNTNVWVENITKDGFTVKVGTPPGKDEKLYWNAVW